MLRRQEHYKIPASATYSRPRCACLACSDLSPSATCNDVGVLYRQPTSTMWCGDDVGDLYYNSNEVDVDHLHRGCSCFGSQSRLTARQQGRPLLQAGSALTASKSQSQSWFRCPALTQYAVRLSTGRKSHCMHAAAALNTHCVTGKCTWLSALRTDRFREYSK